MQSLEQLPYMERLDRPDWEQIIDAITVDMDPWNLDLLSITQRFKSHLDKMNAYELEIPARFLVITSILLNMKATSLDQVEEEPTYDDDLFDEPLPPEHLDFPDVPFPIRRKAKRTITLEELKSELSAAMRIEKKRTKRHREKKEISYGIVLEEKDIEQKLEELISRLRSRLDVEAEVTFEKILEKKENREQIEKFIQLLHLETQGKVRCFQPEFLGELLIRLEQKEKEKHGA